MLNTRIDHFLSVAFCFPFSKLPVADDNEEDVNVDSSEEENIQAGIRTMGSVHNKQRTVRAVIMRTTTTSSTHTAASSADDRELTQYAPKRRIASSGDEDADINIGEKRRRIIDESVDTLDKRSRSRSRGRGRGRGRDKGKGKAKGKGKVPARDSDNDADGFDEESNEEPTSAESDQDNVNVEEDYISDEDVRQVNRGIMCSVVYVP